MPGQEPEEWSRPELARRKDTETGQSSEGWEVERLPCQVVRNSVRYNEKWAPPSGGPVFLNVQVVKPDPSPDGLHFIHLLKVILMHFIYFLTYFY